MPMAEAGSISAFEMEDWALQWSTVVLSVLVILYGSLTLANSATWPWLLLIPALPPLLWSLGIPARANCAAPADAVAIVVVSTVLLLLGVYGISTYLFGVALPGQNRATWAVFFVAGLLGLLLSGIIQCLYAARNGSIASLAMPHTGQAEH